MFTNRRRSSSTAINVLAQRVFEIPTGVADFRGSQEAEEDNVNEEKLSASLYLALRCWPGLLYAGHESDWALMQAFIKREYPSLLSDDDLADVIRAVTPQRAVHAEIAGVSVEGAGTLIKKKTTKAWSASFAYRGRRVANEDGGKFFLADEPSHEIEMEVFRKDKSMGQASMKIPHANTGTLTKVCDIKCPSKGSPIAHVKLSIAMKNTQAPTANALVASLLAEAIRKKTCRALTAFPKLEELSEPVDKAKMETSKPNFRLEVRQTGSASQLGNQEQVSMVFNETTVVVDANGVVACDIIDLTGDVFNIQVVKRRRSLQPSNGINGNGNGSNGHRASMPHALKVDKETKSDVLFWHRTR